jgi:predicted GNAT superfamily acetyltransferase
MKAEIRELQELEDLEAMGRLFASIWGRAGEPVLSSDILKALAVSGNYIAGAYVDGRLSGGLVGWLGRSPRDGLHLHSHILGVLPGDERRGLGFDLKQHQRMWCLDRGLTVMEWTTDPLVGRNVYFNVTKLGAEAPEYFVNFYGQMQDGINAGEESDRLLIRWQLDSERAESAAAGNPEELDVEKLKSWRTNAILTVGDGGEPVPARSSARVLLCQVPDDIVGLRRTNPPLAREWRLAVRDALKEALARDYAIKGATRTGWYVLEST